MDEETRKHIDDAIEIQMRLRLEAAKREDLDALASHLKILLDLENMLKNTE